MTIPSMRLLVMALSLAAALPATSASAGWRDGGFYGEEGWGGEFVPPMRHYRPSPVYGEDEGGYETRSYYPRPWMRGPGYGPDGDEPDYLPDGRAPQMHPPRRVVGVPQTQPRPALPKPRSTALAAPRKQEAIKPSAPAAARGPRPEPVQEAMALPVPRPNLEGMDFEPAP